MIRKQLLSEVEKAKSLVLSDLVKHEYCPILKQSFVYFLWQEDKLIYIGQTFNLTNRLQSHSCNYEFDSYSYIRVDSCFALQIESILIDRFLPPNNKDYKSVAKRNGQSLIRPHCIETNLIKEAILNWIKGVVKDSNFSKRHVCEVFPSVSPISIGKYLLEFMYDGILYEVNNYADRQEFVLSEKFSFEKNTEI